MRKQKKTMVWPVYFDSSKTKKEGRKVPKSAAVSNPNLEELQKAAEQLKLKPEVELSFFHSAIPWRRTGRMWVKGKRTKMQTLMEIAKEIVAIRQQGKK